IALAFAWVAGGLFQVEPDEGGAVLRFGRPVRDELLPGLHYHLPWPIESQHIIKTKEIRKVTIGYEEVDRILGTKSTDAELQRLTGDTNIINVQLMVHYVVSDAGKYLFDLEAPRRLVINAAETALARLVAEYAVDAVLTSGRTTLQMRCRDLAQDILNSYGAGVRVVVTKLLVVEPPEDVHEAFRDVASAKIDRERMINQAQSLANDIVPKARGDAERIRQEAEGYRSERVAAARGAADRFETLLAEYRTAPAITAERLYLTTLRKVLPAARILIPPSTGDLDIRLVTSRLAAEIERTGAVDQ
ncbi:FtsH protease activity modulator HflK, partial [bacterium]|nr:FtsH protease activity modulator HflK [candidate division CSSED10-310 bacterium]